MEKEVSLVFDLETDGLLDTVSRIHCLVIHEIETKQTHRYNDEGNQEPIVRGIQRLADANCVVGHNIIGYDLPVIRKLYPWFEYPPTIVDTLLLSRLIHPNMIEVDKKHNWANMPLQLYGRHSLESYGYRLGEYKGCFGKDTDWKDWSEDMENYCEQDVAVTIKLFDHFLPKLK